jgi:hypothetical protein
LICAFAASGALAGGDEHLLAGARLFREGRFQEAYVELSVAQRLGEGGEAAWYVAAALVKLKRPEEALEAFDAASVSAPDARDALLDYYRALACYDARLFLCADRLLASVEKGAGPKVSSQARKLRAEIAAAVSGREPPVGAIDWYHARGTAALSASQAALAVAFFTEAADLARLRADHYRLAEAGAGLDAARGLRGKGP